MLRLILSAPEVSDDTAIVTGPLSAIATAALTVAGALSVLNSFGVNLEPVRGPLVHVCHLYPVIATHRQCCSPSDNKC